MKKKKLNAKQKRFGKEYVIDLNGTQAAIRAGYAKSGAKTQAVRLLTNDNVQNYISKLKKKTSDKLEITHQDILRRLEQWIESDITEVLGLTVDEVKALPLEVKQLISEFKHTQKTYQTENTLVTENFVLCKFVSKEKALDMLNRHISFYNNTNPGQTNNVIIFELPSNGR